MSLRALLVLVLLAGTTLLLPAQSIQEFVQKGIEYHDAGQYAEAIEIYESGLEKYPNQPDLLYELAYSYSALGKEDKAIELTELNIKKNKDYPSLHNLYLILGNNLDNRGDQKGALKAYKKGLKLEPNSYMLHMNMGVTLMRNSELEKAQTSFEEAIQANPVETSAHFYLAVITANDDNPVPAMMCALRFVSLEPRTERATSAWPFIQELLYKELKQNDDGAFVLEVSPPGSRKENDFSSIEMTLMIMSFPMQNGGIEIEGDEVDEEVKEGLLDMLAKKSEHSMEGFNLRLKSFASLLEEEKQENPKQTKGFFWEYYADFFVELSKTDHLETFGYMVNLSSPEFGKDAEEWIVNNQDRLEGYANWAAEYFSGLD